MSSSPLALRLLKIRPAFWLILACVVSLVPVAILVIILATAGVDTISNDYLRFVRLANQVLSPGYNWAGYFKDSFDNNVHSYAFLFLFRLALADLSHLSVLAESYVGLVLSAVKVLILYLLFTRYVPIRSTLRFLLLPALSYLIFSLSQFSTYSFGETALQMGWTQVGILIGLWLLLLHSRHPLTPWLAAASGVLASYSGGSGILAWPIFFLAILFTDPKNIRKYLTWLMGMGLGLWPYFAFSSYTSTGGLQTLLPFLTSRRFLTGLGLPMANNIFFALPEHPEAIQSGLLGIIFLLLTGLIFILFHSLTRFKRAIPGLLLASWGMAASLQITASRTLFAPWYTSSLMLFWVGLLGLSVSMLPFDVSIPQGNFLARYRTWIWRAAGLAGMLLIAILYALTNHSYEDKVNYLASRSPASAACLRDYETAPTICEGLVFQWGVGNPTYLPEMGAIVDKYHWSVQAPSQEWTLQGDYVLGKGTLPFISGVPSAYWVLGDQDQPAVWSDYHRLNLLLNSSASILWQVNLPVGIKSATFKMELSPVDYAQCADSALSIQLSEIDGSSRVIHQYGLCSTPLALTQDLRSYAGENLLIRITNESTSGQVVRLQFPRIDLNLDNSSASPFTASTVQPSNTDLSASFPGIPQSAAQFMAPPAAGWLTRDLTKSGTTGLWVKTGADPSLTYTVAQPLCITNWSEFYLRMAISDKFIKKYIHITFYFQTSQGAGDSRVFDFPLLSGEDLHTYSLNLDQLNLTESACITSVEIKPNSVDAVGSDLWIQARGFGFLPRQPAP